MITSENNSSQLRLTPHNSLEKSSIAEQDALIGNYFSLTGNAGSEKRCVFDNPYCLGDFRRMLSSLPDGSFETASYGIFGYDNFEVAFKRVNSTNLGKLSEEEKIFVQSSLAILHSANKSGQSLQDIASQVKAGTTPTQLIESFKALNGGAYTGEESSFYWNELEGLPAGKTINGVCATQTYRICPDGSCEEEDDSLRGNIDFSGFFFGIGFQASEYNEGAGGYTFTRGAQLGNLVCKQSTPAPGSKIAAGYVKTAICCGSLDD